MGLAEKISSIFISFSPFTCGASVEPATSDATRLTEVYSSSLRTTTGIKCQSIPPRQASPAEMAGSGIGGERRSRPAIRLPTERTHWHPKPRGSSETHEHVPQDEQEPPRSFYEDVKPLHPNARMTKPTSNLSSTDMSGSYRTENAHWPKNSRRDARTEVSMTC